MDPAQDFEAAVAAEVARRLAARRRRLLPWLAAAAVLLLVLAGGGVWVGWRAWVGMNQDLDRRRQEFEQVNRAYQAELARNQEWQRQRAAAEKATAFAPARSQAEHEAAELNRLLGLVGRAHAHSRAVDKGSATGAASAEQIEAWADETDALVKDAMGIIGRVVLRGTDPGERGGTTLLTDQATARASASAAARKP